MKPPESVRIAAEYVLPLRWSDDSDLDDLTYYLERLSAEVDVTVVDGSPDDLWESHHEAWPAAVRHLRVEPWPGPNGKVAGVMTGVRHARHECVILADDDVRYGPEELRDMVRLLGEYDVIRPTNYYPDLPWVARWDTARTLLNRAVAADYPGTLGVRRSTLLAAGGYSGEVLFENLELIRTIKAVGGAECVAHGLYVPRLPPTLRHFVGQRVRQAYDDFTQPARLVVELCLLPTLVWCAARPRRLAVAAIAATVLAEVGRRRAGGRRVFPASSALWAPLWLLERSVCIWAALAQRPWGVRYGGVRLKRAGTPQRVLEARLRDRQVVSSDAPRRARRHILRDTPEGMGRM